MARVDPQTIKEVGGWRSLAMVERYTHLSPTHRTAAVERAGPFPELFRSRPCWPSRRADVTVVSAVKYRPDRGARRGSSEAEQLIRNQ